MIEDVQKPMTEKVMQELNARVDIDKQKPEEAAKSLPPAGRLRQVDRRFQQFPRPPSGGRGIIAPMLRRAAASFVLVPVAARRLWRER